jgi:hypothetical protein
MMEASIAADDSITSPKPLESELSNQSDLNSPKTTNEENTTVRSVVIVLLHRLIDFK